MADVIHKTNQKVLLIQDYVGFGRCAASVSIPILNCLGHQTTAVYTSLLSTHLAYPNPYIKLLTEESIETIKSYQNLNLKFEAIYSGLILDLHQAEVINKAIDYFGDKAIVAIDPVMADNGKLYKSLDEEIVEEMKKLIKRADIIFPNYTEACLLLDKKYRCENLEDNEIKEMLLSLSKSVKRIVIITSIKANTTNEVTTCCYDKSTNNFYKITNPLVNVSFPGTGDIFASTFLGCYLKNENVEESLNQAISFVNTVINKSIIENYDYREGVKLEENLSSLNNLPHLVCVKF